METLLKGERQLYSMKRNYLRSMLDFWQGSECPSDVHSILVQWNGPAFGCLVMLWFRLKKQLKRIFCKYKGMFVWDAMSDI